MPIFSRQQKTLNFWRNFCENDDFEYENNGFEDFFLKYDVDKRVWNLSENQKCVSKKRDEIYHQIIFFFEKKIEIS